MAAREIQIFSGEQQQNVTNEHMRIDIPIRINGRKAIQIYAVQLSIDCLNLVGQANRGAFQAIVKGVSDKIDVTTDSGFKEIEIRRWGTTILAVSPDTPNAAIACNDYWSAPPSLIISTKFLRVDFESTQLTGSQTLSWIIYYKTVSITDVQDLQLRFL